MLRKLAVALVATTFVMAPVLAVAAPTSDQAGMAQPVKGKSKTVKSKKSKSTFAKLNKRTKPLLASKPSKKIKHAKAAKGLKTKKSVANKSAAVTRSAPTPGLY